MSRPKTPPEMVTSAQLAMEHAAELCSMFADDLDRVVTADQLDDVLSAVDEARSHLGHAELLLESAQSEWAATPPGPAKPGGET